MTKIGLRQTRYDGALKVTGQAEFCADHALPDMLHAIVVQSAAACGHILSIDIADAAQMPGVARIFSHEDFVPLHKGTLFPYGSLSQSYLPLQNDEISFPGQYVAMVAAETRQQAIAAAHAIRIEYAAADAAADIDDPRARRLSPENTKAPPWVRLDMVRGDPDAAFAAAPVTLEAQYSTPRHQHCPIEPHGTIALWDDATGFTVWEPTQWPEGARAGIAEWLDVPIDRVRVISPYIGGGFGGKVEPHPHVAMACAAARELGRPVKLVLTRPQTFSAHGARPATRQTLRIGAETDGRITAIHHTCLNDSSGDDHFIEPGTAITKFSYAVPNLHVQQRIAEVHCVTPTTLRAPGYSVGAFALESALDELAHALEMDPIALRLRNYAETDPDSGKPWSTRFLREAYAAGSKAFGWDRRDPAVRSMRRGRYRVGYGMAGGGYPVYITPAEMRLRIDADGTVTVETSGVDLGTGTYTIIAQTIAETLGVALSQVRVRLGDTSLPGAPLAAGSQLANTLTAAAHKIAGLARQELLALATSHPASPLHDPRPNHVELADGMILADGQPVLRIPELLRRTGRDAIDLVADTLSADRNTPADRHATFRTATRTIPPSTDYAAYSWCAQFAEVLVDEELGTVSVSRMVGAFDCGRLYNPMLAESQWKGGMIMGLGAALMEELMIDRRDAHIVNNNLAEYLLPVAADIPEIEVISVGQPDPIASPLGGKSVGEVGIIGTAAAIANAVFHATGKRVRDLPITIDKIIG
jgi:xanthine dehydrogenase YagR molybdenum-binding subunit